jgi:capsule biosynthesis phosphatase
MIKKDKILVVDIDETITIKDVNNEEVDYSKVKCSQIMQEKLCMLKNQGYWIILSSSRNMRTYEGNIGLIIKHTAPKLIKWLEDNKIPYDELHLGKPWCGTDGFYIDDRAIRPREFIEKSHEELLKLIENDRLKS